MPSVTFAPAALADLKRLQNFLKSKNPRAATASAVTIRSAVQSLAEFPAKGRVPNQDKPELRELVITFGRYGYVAQYRYDGRGVSISRIRHGREAEF
jgi:plasmid stabilization system protein ParE